MPTSPATDAAPATLLAFPDGGWLLVEGGGVAARGESGEEAGLPAGARTVLVVPGTEVAIHWLELAEGLTAAQAAAAARLMLADASAEPLSDLHVAVGRPERGLTPVALVPEARMDEWSAGDPDLILPSPLLLLPPAEGFVRRDGREGTAGDYRGPAAAFGAEPEIAALLTGGAPVAMIDEAGFEAGLAAALSPPMLNLRQGAHARRRQWTLDTAAARRIGWLALALVVLSLALPLVQAMRYSAAAAVLEEEAAALSARAPGGDRAGFTPSASVLFAAIRAVPNVELVRLELRADRTLAAIVTTDTPATLQALRRQIETGGLQVRDGAPQPGGARPSAELLLGPA